MYVLSALALLVFVVSSCKGCKPDTNSNDEETVQESKEIPTILKLAKVAADADILYDFNEGIAGFKKGDTLGFVNLNGNSILLPDYDTRMSLSGKKGGLVAPILFCEGMALVRKNGKYGFVDDKGKEIIPCIYDDANSFSEGYATVVKDEKTGVVDKNGKLVVPYKYDYIGDFSNGIACVKNNNKCGYINYKGEEVIPLKYEDCSDFSDGLAVVVVNGDESSKYGYINKTGKEIIKPIYDMADLFYDERAVVMKDNKYGCIDPKGKVVIPLIYDGLKRFTNGITVVECDGKYQVVDKYGQAITKAIYTACGEEGFSEGLVLVGYYDENKYGLVDKNGREIVPVNFQYGDFGRCHDGFIPIKKGNKWGFLDKNGKQVIPCRFDEVRDFSDGYAVIKKNGIYGYIDTDGKCTLDIDDAELNRVIFHKKEDNKAKEVEKERNRIEEQNKTKNVLDNNWLQGHWVYKQGNYKGHFVIQGNTLSMYSTMNPDPLTYTYRVEGNELFAGEMTVKLDFANQRIDYGDGCWMHKVDH